MLQGEHGDIEAGDWEGVGCDQIKDMRILLTNNHLQQFGGTETWVLTMARELVRQGHEVGIYTHHKGVITDLLAPICTIDDNPQDYDIALINHNTCTNVGAHKKIYTCHSPFESVEAPPAGMDVYVAVSENVQKRYEIETIIKNPIDTALYTPTHHIADTCKEILAITANPIPVPHFTPSRTEETMPELINRADLVVTIGRGVLEAMSCSRNVIVYDTRPHMGFTADGYLDFANLRGNVGGRYHLKEMDWATELAKYNPEHGYRNREYILEHHDVKKIVEQYLNL
jgi:O-antigen biosynthesis protein